MGGMFGESKYDVLKKIPLQCMPKTLLMSPSVPVEEITRRIEAAEMKLPVIFKPDIGERGYLVKRIDNERDIEEYLRKIRGNFMIQELIRLPLEFGVFYMRIPTQKTGTVTSVVVKEMLSVTGNGTSTLQQLILGNDRAKLQWKKLEEAYRSRLCSIIPDGEKIELVSIGNHAMGTRFINGNHLINDDLSRTFDTISSKIPGFYFGRFDLRCASLADLYRGDIKIMELNGCGAEPAHIYDPDFSLWKALPVQLGHWHNIFQISRANKKQGVNYMSHKEAFAYYRKFRSVVK